MTGKRNQTSPVGSPSDSSSKEQDRFLPIANVSRIMKNSLPANAKISKEAKETVQECVSEFISFITGEASDKCQREKRKTINGDDLMWAMTTLGFENYVGPLRTYLNKYRDTEGEKITMARQEEPSPTENTNLGGTDEITKGINSLPTNQYFRGFNYGYYSLGAQIAAKSSYGDCGRVTNYGDNNLAIAAYNMDKIREIGDGNVNRAMATHLHHGLEW